MAADFDDDDQEQGTDARYPSQLQDRFMIRLPDGMRRRIRRAARANGRSMNAEVIAVLEEKFPETLDMEVYRRTLNVWREMILAAKDRSEQAKILDGVRSIVRKVEPGYDVWLAQDFSNDPNGKEIVVHGVADAKHHTFRGKVKLIM